MKINSRTAQRIDPKLRMILDGDEEVNTLRAELSGAVQAAPALTERFPQVRRSFAVPGRPSEAPEPPKLETLSDDVTVSVFIELDDETDPTDLPHPTAQRGKLMTAELTQSQIETVSGYEGVAYVTTGDALSAPTPALSPKHVGQPVSRVVDSELAADSGRGVLIGLIDVGGFDFAHPDFLDPQGNTRFLSIWDQGGEGTPPEGFGYGAELTQKRMNEALNWSRKHHVGATDLLPQSIQVPDAHATHVASIAAGNLGVCPRATIAGVLIALSPDDRDRRRSLYDSTRLAHAVDYLYQLGAKEGMPVVVNISLGTNGHAHDGSSPICRWIDAALTVPGRCVCVAAGNAGQEAPQFGGDLGHLMGRIHTSGQIAASGLETDIEWQVVGNGIADGSENELEIWYEPQDRFDVLVRSPSGDWFGPVGPGQYIENRQLKSGTFLSIYNERYHPANGANRIAVFLTPRLKEPYIGVEAGIWTVRLRGASVRDGRFDAWIERDDPRPLGRIGERDAWRFPSYFTRTSNVDRSSVNSLACGHRIVAVANYDEPAEQINRSSSQGPTRDGRFKPEVAAPGTDIVAARGFSSSHRRWVSMTGTSMASPYVAGVAALMLAKEPRLTASQIVGIMRRTAQPLPGSDYRWQDDAGFGRIRPELCLQEAATTFEQADIGEEGVP
jgi:subtilisin family serine protease